MSRIQHEQPEMPEAITGVEAMRGEGVAPPKGFWADAWSQVLRRRSAVVGLVWVGITTFFAVFSPLLASGHPVVAWRIDEGGERSGVFSPMLQQLSTADALLLLLGIVGPLFLLLPLPMTRARRLGIVVTASVQGAVIALVAAWIDTLFSGRGLSDRALAVAASPAFVPVSAVLAAAVGSAPFLWVPTLDRIGPRLAQVAIVGGLCALIAGLTWTTPLATFEYEDEVRAGRMEAVFTVVPWSPSQRQGDRDAALLPPGATNGEALVKSLVITLPAGRELTETQLEDVLRGVETLPVSEEVRAELRGVVEGAGGATRAGLRDALTGVLRDVGRPYLLGTDAFGQDVMSQMLHASRLAISIGLVSTGIATLLGVTIGSLMGYFGGVLDMLLYRVVEIFMAVPVLFLLIVAAGVLPQNTYVMMAIIGCFTWHGAARFTRAEFLRLRGQDFVQSARAMGLPLRSILFKHMLPNGVTPVLVDASFLIAAAILFEATLSYLGLGPADQPSWGRLLSNATGEVGDFIWWLAIFPGLAIFLTVLSLTLIGEALRDAIDPKLKKARV